MILQALKEYYDRKAADPAGGIAPEGWEWKEIPFIIVLDKKGTFLRFEDTREGEGAKKRGKLFLVPQRVGKTSGVAANLLWGNAAYVLGAINTSNITEAEKQRKTARLPKQTECFLSRIKSELPDTVKKQAIVRFLSALDLALFEKTPQWEDIYQTNPNMSFRFDGEYELYCQNDEVKKVLLPKAGIGKNAGICLVTGEKDTISVTHTEIKGVWGAKSTGAKIVAFQKKQGYDSYGKEQGQNAPVGKTAMFAYTTALNSLLDKKSSQRMQIGDASTVFWSSRKTQFENDFLYLLAEPPKDDPDAGIRRIKNLFDSPRTGGYVEDSGDEQFFVLGLSPNAARISVRFWIRGTVGEFAGNIRRHFEDLEIAKPPNEPMYYSLWRLLVNAAIQDKRENIPPNIAGEFLRSILDGSPYPAALLQMVLRRIKSDGPPKKGKSDRWGANKPVRAALIKAYLNRYLRVHNNPDEKELNMGLDTDQPSTGYRLGRLFAVLEKIQEEANPKINATIRERYYGAACGAPVSVFPTLLRLKNHHLAKLRNRGRAVNFEKMIGEIVKKPFDEFPAHLSLHEQGRFAIGYYHQRQDLFTSKENKDKE